MGVELGIMFSIIPTFIAIIFILVIGAIAYGMFKGIQEWRYNNAQPIRTVAARIVSKRSDVSSYVHSDAGENLNHHTHTSTSYYITFESDESGKRAEFRVKPKEYGLLVEGDKGELTFQGTRYLGFKRLLNE